MKGPAVLKPILPSRYDRFSPRNLSRTPVDDDTPIHVRKSASPPSNRTLTRQALTHPEGGIVYVDERVVSPLPIDEDSWDVGSEVLRQCSDLGDDETTVFIQPRGSDFEYYIVDHSGESIFWIDGQLPDELRIDGQLPGELHGRANYRLNNILAEEYWFHIEAFPSSGSVSIGSVTRLKNVLSGLAIDSVSSDGSTSPFTFEQIRDFLGVLNLFNKQEDIDECQTYVVARIWSMIWHARVINNFGSLEACLHRLSYLSIYPPTFTGVKGILASVTLGAAEKHLDRCSRAWAGRIAYVGAWREFKAKNETEWKQAVQLASVMAVVSLLLPGYSSSKPFNMVPTLLSLSAVACGYYLVTESQSLDNHAAAACVYFRLWEKPGYGLQRVALRNSAPQALLSWALISLVGASIAFPQQGA